MRMYPLSNALGCFAFILLFVEKLIFAYKQCLLLTDLILIHLIALD